MSSSSPWIDESDRERTAEPAYPLLRRASERQAAAREPEAAPEADDASSARSDVGTIEVIVRLTDGGSVLVGRFGDFEDARECARALVESIGDDERQWPFVGGRFLRPGAIVSVDVDEHGPKWSGSADRAASWAARERRGS